MVGGLALVAAISRVSIGFHMLDNRMTLEPNRKVTVAPDILERYVGAYNFDGTPVTVTRSATGLSAE